MNCYDCSAEDRRTTAVAVCGGCGMALCVKHTRVTPRTVSRPNGLGASTTPRPARRAVCGVCDDAARA